MLCTLLPSLPVRAQPVYPRHSEEPCSAQNEAGKSYSEPNRFASREPVERRTLGRMGCHPRVAYRTPSRLVWLGLLPPYTPCCENVTPFWSPMPGEKSTLHPVCERATGAPALVRNR